MTPTLQAIAAAVPGYLRLGRLHLPVYGIFAAAGLIATLWLSQRTGPKVGVSAEKLWDAGIIAVVAAFVASRLLLVVLNFHAFVRYPLLLLALPSLTYGGMLLTGVLVWLYLRWKGLPLWDVLDAWAPCAALLAAVLSVGHFVEGTDAGMPTALPWGLVNAGDTVLGRVHPVQIYAAVLALALCGLLLKLLLNRRFVGHVAAVALMSGGALSFLLDMLRQPVESQGNALLDPGQFVALASMLAGGVVWAVREPTGRKLYATTTLAQPVDDRLPAERLA